jgi:hypothetical protein
MVTKRRRFRQTTTLAERLNDEANRLRERARALPPGPEQTLLWRKLRQTEAALRFDAWLTSTGRTPQTLIGWMGKGRKKRTAPAPQSPQSRSA